MRGHTQALYIHTLKIPWKTMIGMALQAMKSNKNLFIKL